MNIQQMFLTRNKYSRPGIELKKVAKIAVHYVGNPNTSAIANHNYFENLKNQIPDKTGKYCINKDGTYQTYKGQRIKIRWVSSHFLVGMDGKIIQNIPLDEWSYCTNQANGYSISIECCHPDASGKFTESTEKSLAELCAYLCKKFGLKTRDIIRHYDVTGKQCPLYWSPTKYVSKSVADGRFNAFKNKVAVILNEKTEAEISRFPYKVKIICDELNVRKNPGTRAAVSCKVKRGFVYTIVEETKVGTVPWGKLTSGAGWISLLDKYVQKV